MLVFWFVCLGFVLDCYFSFGWRLLHYCWVVLLLVGFGVVIFGFGGWAGGLLLGVCLVCLDGYGCVLVICYAMWPLLLIVRLFLVGVGLWWLGPLF